MNARARHGLLGLAALLAVLLAVALIWDWNWFKGPVERRVERISGRAFSIDGNLDVALAWPPLVVAESVRFGNAPWARTPQMFSAERAEFSLDLRELLAGRWVLPEVRLIAPRIELETAPDGGRNWTFARATRQEKISSLAGLPTIGALRIERGELRYFNPLQNTDLLVAVSTQDQDTSQTLSMKASGRFRKQTLDAEATGGTVLALTDPHAPYPFRGRFRVGATRGSAQGTVTGLQSFGAARLQLDLRGDTLAALHPLTALALPETPPYRIKGLLVRDGARWTFDDFKGQVGDSDLAGDASVTYADDGRPRLVAQLQSRQLDLDDLAGFVGGTPGTGRGETASALQKKQAIQEDAQERVLPDRPLDLARLRSMDADVRFSGLSIRNKSAPLDRLIVHLLLDQGQLSLKPLDFGVAGGAIVSTVSIDARAPVLAMQAKVDFTRLDLAKLLPGNSRIAAGAGLIGGRANLSGSGASTAALLATLDGELGIAMRGGQFSNLLLEGLGLDAAEALRLLIGGDRSVALRCGVMDFAAQDGVLSARSFVIDTTDTKLNVTGSLSLRDETLDLKVHPLPKDWSPLSLRTPLHLRGTFKHPRVRPDKKLLLRGGVAAVLASLVTPLAVLLPLIETGPGKNADCDALVAAVQRQVVAGAGP